MSEKRIKEILDECLTAVFSDVVEAIRDEDGKTAYALLLKAFVQAQNDLKRPS